MVANRPHDLLCRRRCHLRFRVSNMITMALTLLAFPFISLLLEIVLGRIAFSSPGIRDQIGFALIIVGYTVYVTKPEL